jgi:hypothetical protein
MFKLDNRECGSIDDAPFIPGQCVTNQMVLGCDEYDNDMYKIDMILRGEV